MFRLMILVAGVGFAAIGAYAAWRGNLVGLVPCVLGALAAAWASGMFRR